VMFQGDVLEELQVPLRNPQWYCVLSFTEGFWSKRFAPTITTTG